MPTRFRKRPVEVEAVQWTGANETDLKDFTGGQFVKARGPVLGDITASVWDHLHGSWVGVKTGQWVIKGVRGEFYPIDAEVLAETYDRVAVAL